MFDEPDATRAVSEQRTTQLERFLNNVRPEVQATRAVSKRCSTTPYSQIFSSGEGCKDASAPYYNPPRTRAIIRAH